MKFSTLQENMAAGLKTVSRAVAKGSTLPVLSNVLIEGRGDHIKLSAYNLDLGISTIIGAKSEQVGAITVPYKILGDLVAQFPPERIDVELFDETQTITVRCGRYKANIKGMAAEEFPAIPAPHGVEAQIENGTLQSLAHQVAICAATDEARPVFTGVWLRLGSAALMSAAADGFRMGKIHTNGLGVPEGEFSKLPEMVRKDGDGRPYVEAIVPASSIVDVARLAKEDDEEPVTCTIGERMVRFSIGPTIVVCNTINGEFPDIDRIIPQKNDITVQMDREFLQKALKVVHLFSRDASNIMKLAITPKDGEAGEIVLSGTSAELGNSTAPLPAFVQGVEDEFVIAFNSKFMLDAVGAIESPQIRLRMNSPAAPGLLSGVGNDAYLHVIMPMHINS